MKKVIYLLAVDNYAPEITKLTYPLVERYAKKIGAEIVKITERKYPEMPPVYEKFQIFDLARENKADWNIYIDSDALIHPDTFDITAHLKPNEVLFHGKDMSTNRFRPDEYFLRDGRFIGACNWLAVFSSQCLDLYHPLEDMTLEEATKNIFPIMSEINSGVIEASHLIDDYVVSRNIARFGLKHRTFKDLIKEIGLEGDQYFEHQYTLNRKEKIEALKRVLGNWGLSAL